MTNEQKNQLELEIQKIIIYETPIQKRNLDIYKKYQQVKWTEWPISTGKFEYAITEYFGPPETPDENEQSTSKPGIEGIARWSGNGEVHIKKVDFSHQPSRNKDWTLSNIES